MKKVRYAIGALGTAPAAALMMPTANAATLATNAAHAGKIGKTVSLAHLTHGKTARPALSCFWSMGANSISPYFHLSGTVHYKGSGCIIGVFGELDHHQTGLTMRTRLYSIHGTRTYQFFDSNDHERANGTTVWSSSPLNVHAHKACEALVFNNTSSVRYGPICQTF